LVFIFQVGDEFVDYLKDIQSDFNAKDMMTTYTLDVISGAGLGVQTNSFREPNNEIRQNVS